MYPSPSQMDEVFNVFYVIAATVCLPIALFAGSSLCSLVIDITESLTTHNRDANSATSLRAATARFFTPAATPQKRLTDIGFSLLKIPKHLCCHITGLIMNDPVMLKGEGRTYERTAIKRHLEEKGYKGPFVNQVLTPEGRELIPNVDKRSEIESFVTRKERSAAASRESTCFHRL